MKNYGLTESTIKPEPIEIDKYSVWVATDIKEIHDESEYGDITMYQYNLVQYDKDEYISKLAADNSGLQQQIIDTQLALCDLYEHMKEG